MNERIRASQVRVIGEDGAQLGVMAPSEALRLARESGWDLVEVAPQTTPPVCRIMDFNKFRYEEQRREREAKKKRHIARLKEVKFKPHIEGHDYRVKLERLRRFLLRGDQAKVTMVYRGRELAHTELGKRILDRLIEDLKPISRVERSPMLDGRFMTMVFGSDREKIRQLKLKASRQRAQADPPAAAQRQTGREASAKTATTQDAGAADARPASSPQPKREGAR